MSPHGETESRATAAAAPAEDERVGVPIGSVGAAAYTVPTDGPESDGTLEWDSTTLVLASVSAGGETGIGYTYGAAAAAGVIEEELRPAVEGGDAMSPPARFRDMRRRVRNSGQDGLCMEAISAVDLALWDLKARLLHVPLIDLLGAVHEEAPAYASGGFTSYGVDRLREEFAGWAGEGFRWGKLKVGREPEEDVMRVAACREAAGAEMELFVDANGAYEPKEALVLAERFAELGVTWFEEPRPSEDLDQLRLLRERLPAEIELAAGEYGWGTAYYRRALGAGALHVAQADVTRCGGITGFLSVAALCEAFGVALSAHTAPTASLAACMAAVPFRHLEYFHDHVRIERTLFDGFRAAEGSVMTPDRTRAGAGIEFKAQDAREYRVR